MNFLTTIAFLLTIAVAAQATCTCTNNSTPACCYSGSGCRISCPRVNGAAALLYEFTYDCDPLFLLLTVPGSYFYILALVSFELVPGDSARLNIIDVVDIIFVIKGKHYFIALIGDRTEGGCPVVQRMMDTNNGNLPGSFVSQGMALQIIAKQEGTYSCVCSSVQIAYPYDDKYQLQFELGQPGCIRFGQDKNTNNEVQSAVRQQNDDLNQRTLVDIFGSERDKNMFYQYAKISSPQADCGQPSDCKPLKFIESFEQVITNAKCDPNCISPNNDNAARVVGTCLARGLTISNPLYLQTNFVATLILPAKCTQVNTAEIRGAIETLSFYHFLKETLELF